MNTTRTLAAATAVLALAVGATACGPADKPKAPEAAAGSAAAAASSAPAAGRSPAAATPAAFLQKAGTKTGAAKSARVTESIKNGSTEITGKGSISWANGILGTMTMQLPSAAAQKMGTDGAMDAVYGSDAMYINMHMPQAALDQLGGKHWFKYAYADLSKVMGASGDVIKDGLKKADPVQAVQTAIASGQVTEVGKESVDGAPATHYAAEVTTAQLDGTQGGALSADQLAGLRKQLESQGISTTHYDVWVNDQDLLVKVRDTADTKNGPLDVTISYSDYGVQVQPTPPPAADTADAAELIAKAKQSGQPAAS
ncbi:hypothetical protein [Kitasatospora azatica]|uniref:hypothetical protein n=1 Tax=Kitasatospora azatica TaxID=58347 RepID=UPI0006925B18|nr:hypothetical protein [Kitasatospora azatica]